jgi:hypothetical protein
MVFNDDWFSTYFKIAVHLSMLCATTISFTQKVEEGVRIFFLPVYIAICPTTFSSCVDGRY